MDPHPNDSCRRSRFGPRRLGLAALCLLPIAAAGYYCYPALRAWQHDCAAQAAAQKNDVNSEYSHLQKCLKCRPNSSALHLRTARAARRLGHFEEAERCLGHYRRLNGSSTAGNVERLLLMLAQRDPKLEAHSALEFLRQTPRDQPSVPEVLESLSKNYLNDYRLADALAALTLWIEREPNSVAPLLLRGWVSEQQSPNPQSALPDYRRAVEIDAEHNPARLRLAEALVKSRQSAEALPHLEILRQRYPSNPIVLLSLALCREDLGEREEAAGLLDELLTSQRLASVQKLSERLRCDQPAPDGVEAADWYQQAIALAPYGNQGKPAYILDLYVQALVERAKLAARQKRDPLPILRQAVQLDPFDYSAVYQLCLCLEQQGKRAEASQMQRRLAQIRADQRQMSEATAQVVRRPDDPQPRCLAAEILLRNGQPKEALRWIQGALQVRPNSPEALRLLNAYHRQTQQPEHASARPAAEADDQADEKESGRR